MRLAATLALIAGAIEVATMHAHAQDAIASQSLNTATVAQYERIEVTFVLSREYENPYDPDVVEADVIFIEPDGAERVVPAFYSVDFDVVPGSPERYENGHNPGWKARFAPTKLGEHRYRIVVTDAKGTRTAEGAQPFTCTPGEAKGFLRIDSYDPAMLRHETGEPYIPIGHNVGWAPNDTGLAWWETHLDACAAAGLTWARVWMCQFTGGQNLEWSSSRGPYWDGAGRLSPEIAFKLDGIVEMAEERGIAIQLVLQHHGQFSTKVNPNWNENPYNVANAEADGGWLDSPEAFFTDDKARRLTRNRYRYIVARWGYSTAIHSWELWNEVQWTDGWNKDRDAVIAWHGEMAQYLREVDPFDHLITTSSDFMRFRELWALPAIELVQVHTYIKQILPSMMSSFERLRPLGKPVIMAEYGLQAEGRIPEFHPEDQPELERSHIEEALHLHNGIWAAFHLKSGAHLWWWDHYIEKRGLFSVYTPLVKYADGEDIAAQSMAAVPVTLTSPQDRGGEAILAAVALAGESKALVWIYDTGSQYGNEAHGEIAGATAAVPMPDGTYSVEYWNTRGEGGMQSTEEATASDGALRVSIPAFRKDVAVKLSRSESSA